MEKPNKEHLTAVAEEFNKTLALEPPIKTGRRVTAAALISDITEAAGLLTDEDELSAGCVEVLNALGIATPSPAEKTPPEPAVENEVVETPPPVKGGEQKVKTPKPAPKPASKGKYTRAMAVADAIKNATATDRKSLSEEANRLYVSHGGNDNVKDAGWWVGLIVPVLDRLGYVWAAAE